MRLAIYRQDEHQQFNPCQKEEKVATSKQLVIERQNRSLCGRFLWWRFLDSRFDEETSVGVTASILGWLCYVAIQMLIITLVFMGVLTSEQGIAVACSVASVAVFTTVHVTDFTVVWVTGASTALVAAVTATTVVGGATSVAVIVTTATVVGTVVAFDLRRPYFRSLRYYAIALYLSPIHILFRCVDLWVLRHSPRFVVRVG